MKPPIPIFVTAGFVLATTPLLAASKTHLLEPSVPRTVAVSESQAPTVIRAGLLQSTLIVLPSEEKVANVFAGDTVDWVFDGGHVASRFVSVKPKVANRITDMHIVSDHGNEYTLELHEVSGDRDPHYDSKVMLDPIDQVATERLIALPIFVPAADLDKAKQEVAAAKAAQMAEVKVEEEKTYQYRSRYPSSLHFDFTWEQNQAKEVGLEQIWRDDKFTYLRGQFRETPALYEVKDGKPSLINFDFSNGLFTVAKEVTSGYLAIGKQKVEFHRLSGGK